MNHGRPTKAVSREEGEAAEAVPADCPGSEGYRAELADPEVETVDAPLSVTLPSSAESKA